MPTGDTGPQGPVAGYVLRERIGVGASSEVWRGEPVDRPGRVLAIKRVPCDADAAAVRAVRRDADTLAALSHPSILPVVDIVQDGDGVALVTKYAAGGSLAGWLAARTGGLSPARVADLGARLGSALAAGHNAGIVHGDVKPANVLFDAEGQPLLADFGASRVRGAADPAVGTAEYLDPDVAVDGRPADVTADVYGLAATLYESLAGVPPHAGSTPQQTLAAADRGIHVSLSDLVDAPSDLSATIERGLRRNPSARFASIADMAGHLDEARRRLEAASFAEDDAEVVDDLAPRPDLPVPDRSSGRASHPRTSTQSTAATSRPPASGKPPPTPAERSSTTSFGPRPPVPVEPEPARRAVDRRLALAAAVLVVVIPVAMVVWLAGDADNGPEPDGADRAGNVEDLSRNPDDADGATDADDQGELSTGDTEHSTMLRQPGPACPDAVAPTTGDPYVDADVDARGCTVPAAWNGRVLEVAIDGDLRRFDLAGEPDDILLFGDFSCDGHETPALYRSSSGEVFVFPDLDPDREITVTAQPGGTAGGTPNVLIDQDGCAHVEVANG